jgi:hypothetical protein
MLIKLNQIENSQQPVSLVNLKFQTLLNSQMNDYGLNTSQNKYTPVKGEIIPKNKFTIEKFMKEKTL